MHCKDGLFNEYDRNIIKLRYDSNSKVTNAQYDDTDCEVAEPLIQV